MRPPPRLRIWRDRRGLTQEALAEKTGQSQSKIARIERGDQPLDMEDAEVFASVLDTGPTDLFPFGPETVPLRFRIGAGAAASPELARPWQRVPVPAGIVNVEYSFATELRDHSADLLYPPGTIAIARERAAVSSFAPGDPVVVGVRMGEAFARVYIGELSPTALGDVLVALRTSLRDLPVSVPVRRASVRFLGAADRPPVYLPETVDVTPRTGDEAEIIGRIERVIAPASAASPRELAA